MTTLGEKYASQVDDPAIGDHWSGPPWLVDAIAERLRTDERHLVLDVACGVGGPARRLARLRRCAVIAVDLLPDVITTAARREEHPGRVRYVAGSAERLPLRARSVDQAWCLGAVAHVRWLEAFADEIARVLRPTGDVAITEAFATGDGPPAFAASAPKPWSALAADRLVGVLEDAGLSRVVVEPWPARIGDAPPSDPALAADLRAGRLAPALVTAHAA